MRRRFGTVLIAAGALASLGMFVAPGATADCTTTRGAVICTDDGPPPAAPAEAATERTPLSQRSSFTPYPCTIDWYCQTDYGTRVGNVLYGHN
jgi:hypothetical protein